MSNLTDSDIRSYFKLKSKYILDSEYQTIIRIMDKLKINEEREFIKIKEEGDLEFRKGNFSEAAKLYSKFIEGNPTPILYNNRAACYHKLKMYEESVEDCKKGLLLDNSYIKFYLRLAVIKKEVGDIDEAVYWSKKGLEVDKNHKILVDLLNQLVIKDNQPTENSK